jgi:hypothetical protein
MEHWRLAYLGMRRMPRDLSEFELATFFTFSSKERALINVRRGPLYQYTIRGSQKMSLWNFGVRRFELMTSTLSTVTRTYQFSVRDSLPLSQRVRFR